MKRRPSPLSCNLRRLRGDRTQKDVATAIGVTQPAYSRWESGENEPDLETLNRLADYLGVGIGDLVSGQTQAVPAA